MPHHCIAYGCQNTSDDHPGLSFHSIPFKEPLLLNKWFNRIKRDKRHVSLSNSSKICCSHFKTGDFTGIGTQRQRLKKDAVPSKFSWTEPAQGEADSSSEDERPVVKKRREWQEDEDENTETASEGAGDPVDPNDQESKVSQKTQYSAEDLEPDAQGLPCKHAFSIKHLRSKCTSSQKEQELFMHFTGFPSFERFKEFFQFVCPTMEHSDIIYWGTNESKQKRINTEQMLSEDVNSSDSSDGDVEDNGCISHRNYTFEVWNELLLTLMKLRTGASNTDLAERFNTDKGTVSRILITWLNHLYVTLGSLIIWPHRDIVLKNSPTTFSEKYPNTIIIIDATELIVQVPSSLKKQSECFSQYKRHTTLKCLIGVDPMGGIMFVCQLYEGSISDKELVRRSGFLKIIELKKQCGEIKEGDAIMADRGFTIKDELDELGLKLNVPPFLREKGCFSAADVIRTQTIAKHRIHVERAIGKVRRFQIFNSPIPISMFGTINQIWTVVCLLSNFQNPILAVDEVD